MNEPLLRLSWDELRATLRQRLAERAPGRVQLVAGPRQVGKTTLLLDLADKARARALYVTADAPEASLPGFWERLWSRADERVAAHGSALVFLDEVHLFPDWSARLKAVVDRHHRERAPIHVVATGSSSLKLGEGSRESLAGRFERLTLSHWSASAIARAFRLKPATAAELVVRQGSYPGAMALRRNPARWSAYLRDAILEPALGKDVLALAHVKRPALLRQLFAMAASSPAKIVALQKLQGQLQDRGAIETLQHYLGLLEEAFLVAALPKFSAHELRRRAAPPKLIVLNNALLAALEPLSPRDPVRFGAFVENACLAYAWNAGQRVSYWREEPLEVDAVLEGSWGAWAVEVKTGPFGLAELRGLFELARRFPKLQPLVLCEEEHCAIAQRAGARALSWRDFLLGALAPRPALSRPG